MPRLMVTVAIVAAATWVWVCFFAGLDDYEAMAYLYTGSCCGFPALGLFALIAFGLLVVPRDSPPADSAPMKLPRLTILHLMIVIAIAAMVFAAIVAAHRLMALNDPKVIPVPAW
jgi:hypothetical protein